MSLHVLLKNGDVKIVTQDVKNGYMVRDIGSESLSRTKLVLHSECVMVDTNTHVINFYKQKLLNQIKKHPLNFI